MQEKKSELDKTINRLYSYYKVYTDTALSKKMSVSRSAISQWRYKGVIPKKILSKYDQIILGEGEKVVVAEKPIHITKGEEQVDVQASYIIDLQKDKIKAQEKELSNANNTIKLLKDNPIQSTLWENMTPDFETQVEIKPKLNIFSMGLMLKQAKMTSNGEWAKALELTEKELIDFHDIGKWHEWGKSPIEQIMVTDSKDAITNEIPTLENIINFVKNLTGDHYYTKTVVYRYKGNTVVTHCASKIKWWESPKIVLTKNTILKVTNNIE